MTDLETLASAIHPLWDQAKGISKYDQQEWIDYHTVLVEKTVELARLRIELARYHQVRQIIQEIVCDYGEEVPRGTG